MTAIVLTIHTMIVLALVGVVLLQRSEGGALGMGGGGGGGLMSGRGAATALTRTTTVLASLFFASSLTLALINNSGDTTPDIIPDAGEESLQDDDFSDILGAGDDAIDEQVPPADPFALPDDLGISEQPAPAEDEPSSEDEPPQR